MEPASASPPHRSRQPHLPRKLGRKSWSGCRTRFREPKGRNRHHSVQVRAGCRSGSRMKPTNRQTHRCRLDPGSSSRDRHSHRSPRHRSSASQRPPGQGVSVDSFIRAKIADAQLKPAPQADRRTLIRRLYLDLTGLPPTPEQVAAFLAAEDSGQAYAVLVDELLASPRYGERWAQYWLDLVRYADTHGFEVNTRRETRGRTATM